MKEHERITREGMADAIVNLLIQKKVRQAFQKIDQQAEENPEVMKDLTKLHTDTQRLIAAYKKACTKKPGSIWCDKLKKLLDGEV